MSTPGPFTLKGVSLFDGLPQKVREGYEKRCAWRRCAHDEQIIERLSDTQEVFFIAEGAVRVVIYSAAGREISFDNLAAGEFFGELAAIDGKPRSASVVALSDTLLASMPPEAFRRMAAEHPQIALTIMKRLSEMVRASDVRIVELSTLAADKRVRAELVRLARPFIRRDGTARVSPMPTHFDVASRVSTTRETVARVLSDLVRRGLIRRESSTLLVRDFARLEQSSGETLDVGE